MRGNPLSKIRIETFCKYLPFHLLFSIPKFHPLAIRSFDSYVLFHVIFVSDKHNSRKRYPRLDIYFGRGETINKTDRVRHEINRACKFRSVVVIVKPHSRHLKVLRCVRVDYKRSVPSQVLPYSKANQSSRS